MSETQFPDPQRDGWNYKSKPADGTDARNEALEEVAVAAQAGRLNTHDLTKLAQSIRGLKDRPQTCFECGADLAALAPICPKCNPNYQSAARLASDFATAERLLKAVRQCHYTELDSDIDAFLARDKDRP